MAYSRRQVAQAQQLYKIAADAAYTHRAALMAIEKLASKGQNGVSLTDLAGLQNFAGELGVTLSPPAVDNFTAKAQAQENRTIESLQNAIALRALSPQERKDYGIEKALYTAGVGLHEEMPPLKHPDSFAPAESGIAALLQNKKQQGADTEAKVLFSDKQLFDAMTKNPRYAMREGGKDRAKSDLALSRDLEIANGIGRVNADGEGFTIDDLTGHAQLQPTSQIGLLSKLKSLANSKFDSLQGSDLLKNLTKGQMAGGAALLAALGGGAYMYKKHRDKKRGEAEAEAGRAAEASRAAAELKRQEEAAAAIMAAKNLSEAQRKKLIRNLGIGAGTALGSYGLYRALR